MAVTDAAERADDGERILVCDDDPQIRRALEARAATRRATRCSAPPRARRRWTALSLSGSARGDRRPDAAGHPRDRGLPPAARVERDADPGALGARRGGDQDRGARARRRRLCDKAVRRRRAGGACPGGACDAPGRNVAEPRIELDGLVVDLAAHAVWLDGGEVRLTPIEFSLLRVLAGNRGLLMTHRQLLSRGLGTGVRGCHAAAAHAHREPAPQAQRRRAAPVVHPHRRGDRVPVSRSVSRFFRLI